VILNVLEYYVMFFSEITLCSLLFLLQNNDLVLNSFTCHYMADLEGNGTTGNCPLNLLPTFFRDFLLYVFPTVNVL
jgi:hypothetical protein